jgi:hypothetical protein
MGTEAAALCDEEASLAGDAKMKEPCAKRNRAAGKKNIREERDLSIFSPLRN